MKKFINRIDTLLDDSLRGFAAAHADLIHFNQEPPRYITRLKPAKSGKVALVSGGGSGHEPLHAGFVGYGMLDAACPGQIFTSPTPDQMLAASAVENGGGVLFIVKNYAGDVMNFDMAAELLDSPNASVLICDDVSLPKDHPAGRRGVAGTLIVEKIVGAAAEQGADLATCQQLGTRVNAQTASMGIALSSCTVPALGQPTFQLATDEIEMGVGIHGERGRQTLALRSASELIEHLAHAIDTELQPAKGQIVLLHVNGFGATHTVARVIFSL